MMDSIVVAFREGKSAAKDFYESVSSMLEDLAKQMVYSVTIGPLLEKAQEQMLGVMTNAGLSDEQKFEQWSRILNTMLNEAVGQQDLANRLLSQFQSIADEKGFDIFKSKDSYTQEASKGFAASMSQDTAEALEGRFTAIQINTANILASVIEVQSLIVLQLNHLEIISRHSKLLVSVNTQLKTIADNTKNL